MSAIAEYKAVALLSEIISLERGYSPAKAGQIKTAAALHDIGKQKIPVNILNKPGKLDAWEFEIMKTHTKLGAEMLSVMQGELGEIARTICRYHHEKWDKSGYWGIFPGDLPEYVAIVSIADVFVACRSVRPYKSALSEQETLNYIRAQVGTQFSPELTEFIIPLIQSDSRVSAIFL